MSDPHNDGDDTPSSDRPPAPDTASAAAPDAANGDALENEQRDDQSTLGDDHESVVDAVDDPELEAMIDDRRTLHGRVRYQWILNYLIPAVVLAAIAGYAALTIELVADVESAVGVGAGVVAAVMVFAVVRAFLLYRTWRYVVREDSLYLTRGVLTRVQTVVPYVRVQHIDTRRTAFERVLGLSSLVVYTAGSRGADVTIPGLTPDRAADLQAHLKRLAIESEDEDAV